MSIDRFLIGLVGAAFTASSPMAASAQCVTADPAVVPDTRLDPLDANGSSQVVQPVTLRLRRVGIDTAPITVTYQILDEDSPLQARVGMSGGPLIEWRSNDVSRDIGVTRNQGFPLLRSGKVTLSAGELSKDIDLRLFLMEARQDLPAGVYREQYTLRYWCGDPDAGLPSEMPGVLSVALQVPNVLSANVAGGSTRGEIDFQNFATLSRSLSISVRSTGRYVVTARSMNGGSLVREGTTATSALDRIPYIVRFGGVPLATDEGSGFTNPRAGLQGRQIPLDVQVDSPTEKRAGRYSDTLLLTLAPAT